MRWQASLLGILCVRGLYFSQEKLKRFTAESAWQRWQRADFKLFCLANDMSIQKNHSDFCDSRVRIEVFSDSNSLVDLIISIIS